MYEMFIIALPSPHPHKTQLLSSLNGADIVIVEHHRDSTVMHTHEDLTTSLSICPEKTRCIDDTILCDDSTVK